ncbi:ankyrin repeat domain-containing protein [Streptomyces sp. NPDC060000]|uniref:ankyrin repeat domain-containing protein n=1 Tax=Streptomyces sp. NPDC060000 TaxID=3347031 RepID=UPI0036B9F42E
MGSAELVAAVRRGDAEAVRELLEGGADPETCDPADGVPLLCRAVAAYDAKVVEALVLAGADPLRPLPDGDTPLLRAVDGGSVEMIAAVLPMPLAAEPRAELLARARFWTETDLEAELRRRTGASGPAGRMRVEEPKGFCHYEQITLGGMTVRDGHAGVLIQLEECFGVGAPFGEVLARALVRPDRDHVVWTEAVIRLSLRRHEPTWADAADLRDHPDRLRRLFAADLLRLMSVSGPHDGYRPPAWRDFALFFPWASKEEDPEVLALVLDAVIDENEEYAEEIEALGLSYATHPDPRVRCVVPSTLSWKDEGSAHSRSARLEVLYALARDPDSGVRERAAYQLTHCRGELPGIDDVLAGLLDDELRETRVHAARGLALRGDPRCVEAERRLLPLDPDGWPDGDLVRAMWRYEEGLREAAGAKPSASE